MYITLRLQTVDVRLRSASLDYSPCSAAVCYQQRSETSDTNWPVGAGRRRFCQYRVGQRNPASLYCRSGHARAALALLGHGSQNREVMELKGECPVRCHRSRRSNVRFPILVPQFALKSLLQTTLVAPEKHQNTRLVTVHSLSRRMAISPVWAVMICRHSDKPMPLPSRLVVKNGTNS